MRNTFETISTFSLVAVLYTAPFLMAFFSLSLPTFTAEPGPVHREARYLLAKTDLLPEAGEDEGDEKGETDQAQKPQPEQPAEEASDATTESHTAGTATKSAPIVNMGAKPVAKSLATRASFTGRSAHTAGTAPVKKTRKKKRRRRQPKCLDGTDSITEIGKNRYAIERELVDTYARDLQALASLARVAWHEDDEGKVDGFVVRRIRCGSVLHEAGIRNGDVVHAVNGRRIRSLAKAIPLWWSLRKRPMVHLRITRGEESMRLFYRLS